MFKKNYYKKNEDKIVVPKKVEKQEVKSLLKPNVNKNTYENIRNLIQGKEQETISNSDVKDIKNKKNKLNIV